MEPQQWVVSRKEASKVIAATHPIFRRFVSSATEMARLANKPLRPLISDVLGRDFSCDVTRALQL
jgi:hypothetical protein